VPAAAPVRADAAPAMLLAALVRARRGLSPVARAAFALAVSEACDALGLAGNASVAALPLGNPALEREDALRIVRDVCRAHAVDAAPDVAHRLRRASCAAFNAVQLDSHDSVAVVMQERS
jgi:hypothetical protein